MSTSPFGVDVMMHEPPVDSVGAIAVQNSTWIAGGTNANSSRYRSEIENPRPEFSDVASDIIMEPLSNTMLCLYQLTYLFVLLKEQLYIVLFDMHEPYQSDSHGA